MVYGRGIHRTIAMFRIVLLFFVVSFVLSMPSAPATTVLLLKDGGTLEGELLNPDEINRRLYQVKTAEGLEISLDVRLVEGIQRQERDVLIEYNREAPLSGNTVENHIYWARWCNERQLFEQAKVHWQQVLELDPDHGDARRTLGYTETQGGWVSIGAQNENRGLILDRGRWRTSHEIEISRVLEDQKQAEQQWQRRIPELIRGLPQSEAELQAIRDPAAFIPIRNMLAHRNPPPAARMILLRTLMQIPDASAIQFVIGWTIRPKESDEIRRQCLEELMRRIDTQPEIRAHMVAVYRNALRSNAHQSVIDMAAEVLGNIGGREAVPELIEVLVVNVTETIRESPSGYSIGPGGSGGLTQGTRTTRNSRDIPNQTVLTALRKLTGANFDFNKEMWRNWYRDAYRSPYLNLRRT